MAQIPPYARAYIWPWVVCARIPRDLTALFSLIKELLVFAGRFAMVNAKDFAKGKLWEGHI